MVAVHGLKGYLAVAFLLFISMALSQLCSNLSNGYLSSVGYEFKVYDPLAIFVVGLRLFYLIAVAVGIVFVKIMACYRQRRLKC